MPAARTRPWTRWCLALAGSLASTSLAAAQGAAQPEQSVADARRMLMVTPSLEVLPVQVLSVDDEGVLVQIGEGRPRRLPLQNVVALLRDRTDRELAARLAAVTQARLQREALARAREELQEARGRQIARAPGQPAQDQVPPEVLEQGPTTEPAQVRTLPPGATGGRGVLFLASGERFPGALAPADAWPEGGEILAWDQTRFGLLQAPLDQVERLELSAEPLEALLTGPRLRVDGEDTVWMLHGDVLSGFVASISPSTLTLERDGTSTSLAMDRVAALALQSDAPPRDGMRIWLADATIADVSEVRITDDGAVRLSRGETSADLLLADLEAIVVRHAALWSLADLPIQSAPAPESSRRWTPPAIFRGTPVSPLGVRDVELPGPMVVTWTLPPDARRVAFQAELAMSSRDLGDCVLIVQTADGRELARHRLSSATPIGSVNVSIPPGTTTLSATLEAGDGGVLQDRVVLRRGMVFVGPYPEPGAPASPR